MENFIYQSQLSITDDLCDDIVELFKKNTIDDVDDKNIIEYEIPSTLINKSWSRISNYLFEELQNNLINYYKILKNITLNNEYKMIDIQKIIVGKMKIQNYTTIMSNNYEVVNSSRMLNIGEELFMKLFKYVWFLNDDYDLGEMIFFGNYKVKPIKGMLLIFPISWVFNYVENMNIGKNKYIIMGDLQIKKEKRFMKQ